MNQQEWKKINQKYGKYIGSKILSRVGHEEKKECKICDQENVSLNSELVICIDCIHKIQRNFKVFGQKECHFCQKNTYIVLTEPQPLCQCCLEFILKKTYVI